MQISLNQNRTLREVVKIRVDKVDFVEFLELAAKTASLAFSTNPEGKIWPTGAYKGLTKEEEGQRIDVGGRSRLLDKIAGIYTGSVREKGGKFKVDFHGAYCYGRGRYFIELTKSRDLIDYESAIPNEPETRIELFAQMAKKGSLA